MLPYLLLIFAVCGLIQLSIPNINDTTLDVISIKKSRIIYNDFAFAFAIISLSLFAGLRDGLGTDYYPYVEIFESISATKSFGTIEKGFSLLIILLSYVWNNIPFYFTICALIIYLPILLAAKRYSLDLALSIFLFIAFGFFINSFNILRQWIAIGIFFYSLRFVYDKKFIKYLLFCVFASLFHLSVILMIPIYFLARIKKHLQLYRIIIIVIGILCYFYISEIFQVLYKIFPLIGLGKYVNYLSIQVGFDKGSGLTFPLFSIIVYFLYLLKKFENVEFNDTTEYQMNLVIIGFIFSLIGQSIEMVLRLQFFFMPILIILIPNIIDKYKSKDIMKIIIIALGLAYFCYSIINSIYYPYKNILWRGQ